MGTRTPAQHVFMFLWIIGSVAAGDLEAKPGEDVTLPCNSLTDANVTKLVWKRPELEDVNVFFFRNKRADENYQDPRYRGRVELKDPEMKNGDVSVVLKKVTVSDTGTYQCRVTTSNMPTELLHSVHLVVSEGESVFLLKSSSIGLKMRNPPSGTYSSVNAIYSLVPGN
ncbi:coxsackievirus and adenovirus receptor homolog [Pseudochaenichthys georgianus]|uniref:coxsackievirus and adenovirus receptor homolog n=1 Tax=Pseudochaenichthys georgianus TaxID=52239 RepID=UPI00146EB3B9|nr:coxsackievirus and adenovirus receptor homolog [Pseudochaenichthys georgianus]